MLLFQPSTSEEIKTICDDAIHYGTLSVCRPPCYVKVACGRHILRVIVETCLLTEEEKIKMCGIVSASGSDYIKTSTGGTTREDIALFKVHVSSQVKIKAAGDIKSLQNVEDFITWAQIIKLVKGQQVQGY